MAVLYKSDMAKVNSFAAQALSNESSDTDKIINNINDFINSSQGNLTGTAWNKERERLSALIPALEKRKNISSSLLSSIKAANDMMDAYIAGFPWSALASIPDISIPINQSIEMVDDSWAGELQKVLNNAQTNYNLIYFKEDDSAADKRKKERNRQYYDSIITACKTVIDYLSELQPTAQAAYGLYDNIAAELINLKTLNQNLNDSLNSKPETSQPRTSGSRVVYVSTPSESNTSSSSSKEEPVSTQTQPENNKNDNTQASVSTPTATSQSPVVEQNVNTNTNTSPTVSISEPVRQSNTNQQQTTNTQTNIETQQVETTPNNTQNTVNEPTTVIPNTNTETTKPVEPTINKTGTVTTNTVNHKNNTLKNIGAGILGAAAVGGVAYGTYQAAKKMKDNSSLGDDPEEYSSDYDDSENVDINYGKDDI